MNADGLATPTPAIPAGHALCPLCNGTGRAPVPETSRHYVKVMATYRASDDTLACRNCGGQTMTLEARGYTRIDPKTGLGCLHAYAGRNAGRCYTVYTCSKGCGSSYDVDSSD